MMLDKLNHDQVATNENYNFFHHYDNNEVDPTSLDTLDALKATSTTYYSSIDFRNNIAKNCSDESLGCVSLNCQSIGGHWSALKQFLSELEDNSFRFDVIGLSEIFRIPPNTFYNLDGYHTLEHKVRSTEDDGRGGVGLFINSNLKYKVRPDLSVFIPHVCESLFIELTIQTGKSMIIGIIYRPNTAPRANLDIFTESIGRINDIIADEKKKAIIMGDFNIDMLKYGTRQKTKLFIVNVLTRFHTSN